MAFDTKAQYSPSCYNNTLETLIQLREMPIIEYCQRPHNHSHKNQVAGTHSLS